MLNKKVIALVVLSSVFAMSCGSKKKKSPAPAGPSADAGPGVPGPRGPQGERGPAGTMDPFTFQVFNGSAQTVGKTTWEQTHHFNDGQPFSFLTADGAVFTVDPYTGYFEGGAYCVYADLNCSGTCLFPAGPGAKDKIVQGVAGFFRMTSSQGRSQRPYNSYVVANGSGGTSCTNLPSPGTEWLVDVTSAWTFPGGITYPLLLPLDVR